MEKETGRIEAFSDGVFAIAITLLILEVRVPEVAEGRSLAQALLAQWPSYVAFLVSFAAGGIVWINHHRVFTLIRRADHTLMVLNLLLLLCITVIPFTTALVADYLAPHGPLSTADQRTAAIVYNGIFLLMALAFNRLWAYASAGNRLFDPQVDLQVVRAITRSFRYGPLLYAGIFVIGLVSVPVSLAASLVLAGFYALPGRRS